MKISDKQVSALLFGRRAIHVEIRSANLSVGPATNLHNLIYFSVGFHGIYENNYMVL